MWFSIDFFCWSYIVPSPLFLESKMVYFLNQYIPSLYVFIWLLWIENDLKTNLWCHKNTFSQFLLTIFIYHRFKSPSVWPLIDWLPSNLRHTKFIILPWYKSVKLFKENNFLEADLSSKTIYIFYINEFSN